MATIAVKMVGMDMIGRCSVDDTMEGDVLVDDGRCTEIGRGVWGDILSVVHMVCYTVFMVWLFAHGNVFGGIGWGMAAYGVWAVAKEQRCFNELADLYRRLLDAHRESSMGRDVPLKGTEPEGGRDA